jgi:hypothetical protein
MDNIIAFPTIPAADLNVGVAAFISFLRHVRAVEGADAVALIAEEVVIAASSILAHEAGSERARRLLDRTSAILPERR